MEVVMSAAVAAVVDEGLRFVCGTQPAYLIAAPFRA